MGLHNGRLWVLPSYWFFPKTKIKQVVDNWFMVNAKDKIPQLNPTQNHHVAHIRTEKYARAGKMLNKK